MGWIYRGGGCSSMCPTPFVRPPNKGEIKFYKSSIRIRIIKIWGCLFGAIMMRLSSRKQIDTGMTISN